jgi:hypothetical protein
MLAVTLAVLPLVAQARDYDVEYRLAVSVLERAIKNARDDYDGFARKRNYETLLQELRTDTPYGPDAFQGCFDSLGENRYAFTIPRRSPFYRPGRIYLCNPIGRLSRAGATQVVLHEAGHLAFQSTGEDRECVPEYYARAAMLESGEGIAEYEEANAKDCGLTPFKFLAKYDHYSR